MGPGTGQGAPVRQSPMDTLRALAGAASDAVYSLPSPSVAIQRDIPQAIERNLPAIAELILGMMPGSGDAMAVRDAADYSGRTVQSAREGQYGDAAGNAALTALMAAGALPMVPGFGGMVNRAGKSPMNVDRIANNVVRAAEDMNLLATVSKSGKSESQYVYVKPGADAAPVKVRISRHDAMPWNDAGDIDIDPSRPEGTYWTTAVSKIAQQFGRDVPSWVGAAVNRRLAREESEKAKADALASYVADQRAVAAARVAALDAAAASKFPAEWALAESLTGAERRDAKSILRRKVKSDPGAD